MNSSLSNVAIRLLECLASPADAKVLGPQIVGELLFVSSVEKGVLLFEICCSGTRTGRRSIASFSGYIFPALHRCMFPNWRAKPE